MNKKFTSRILSMLLAVLMLISMMPTSVFAAPASDIPAEMLDNVFLDALEYTGYKVQAQRDDGTIFKKYSGGATAYLSKISYGLNKYGTETVAKSGTATGLAPDIAGFESSGLCCASFVSYVYYNYLPNIAGLDTSIQSAHRNGIQRCCECVDQCRNGAPHQLQPECERQQFHSQRRYPDRLSHHFQAHPDRRHRSCGTLCRIL